ncbi:MAG: HAD-IIIA family hydrolase [Bacteroidales bacterium]|nr:HAD-IIIA family hydrolase [Bacteroidales bacterium]
MSSIPYDLKRIKAFIFDVDGVLSKNVIGMSETGEPLRTVNIKDGYALQLAIKKGYIVAIITGAYTDAVRMRFERLGIQHIYMKSAIKTIDYEDFMQKMHLKDEEVVYVGDDIPDYEVMQRAGLPIAPADAAPEIKSVAKYISPIKGGEGVAREIIEQVMKIHGNWFMDDAFGW